MNWACWVLSLPVMLFSCGPFFTGAWRAAKQGRVSMDTVSLGMLHAHLVIAGGSWLHGLSRVRLAGRRLPERRCRHRDAMSMLDYALAQRSSAGPALAASAFGARSSCPLHPEHYAVRRSEEAFTAPLICFRQQAGRFSHIDEDAEPSTNIAFRGCASISRCALVLPDQTYREPPD